MGIKDDNEKAPVMTGAFLLFPRAMIEIAKVSKLGADKYGVILPDRNWLEVENNYNRYTDAVGRHLLGEAINGPTNLEGNTEVLHAAQAAWDALCRLEIYLVNQERSKSKTIDEWVATKEATNPARSWWENWQAKRYPSPAAAAPTPDHPSPSPHSHSHTSLGLKHTDPKDDLRKAWEDYSAHLNNADKPLAHTHS